jgi:hypothetical protein
VLDLVADCKGSAKAAVVKKKTNVINVADLGPAPEWKAGEP